MAMPEPVLKQPMTQVAFAARVGVDVAAVRKGIKSGRLSDSLTWDEKGTAQIADVALAEREWEDNANALRTARGGKSLRTIAEERKRLLRAQARREELRVRQQRGLVVNAKQIEAMFASIIVTSKNKLRGIPARAKQRLPHLTAEDLAELALLIDEALEELATDRKGDE